MKKNCFSYKLYFRKTENKISILKAEGVPMSFDSRFRKKKYIYTKFLIDKSDLFNGQKSMVYSKET